jgi:hypothetical protein
MGQTWTKPVDIVAGGVSTLTSVDVARSGLLQVLWHNVGQNVTYYTTAPVAQAASGGNWSKAIPLASGYSGAQLLPDRCGRLYLVYPGLVDSGVFYQVSEDGGAIWSRRASVAKTASASAAAEWARVAAADDGTIHVVWTELTLPTGWPRSPPGP